MDVPARSLSRFKRQGGSGDRRNRGTWDALTRYKSAVLRTFSIRCRGWSYLARPGVWEPTEYCVERALRAVLRTP